MAFVLKPPFFPKFLSYIHFLQNVIDPFHVFPHAVIHLHLAIAGDDEWHQDGVGGEAVCAGVRRVLAV
jgi:hypothetical protein